VRFSSTSFKFHVVKWMARKDLAALIAVQTGKAVNVPLKTQIRTFVFQKSKMNELIGCLIKSSIK
jgi:hypothetical protein